MGCQMDPLSQAACPRSSPALCSASANSRLPSCSVLGRCDGTLNATKSSSEPHKATCNKQIVRGLACAVCSVLHQQVLLPHQGHDAKHDRIEPSATARGPQWPRWHCSSSSGDGKALCSAAESSQLLGKACLAPSKSAVHRATRSAVGHAGHVHYLRTHSHSTSSAAESLLRQIVFI